jgi:hypothetical protein
LGWPFLSGQTASNLGALVLANFVSKNEGIDPRFMFFF